MTKETRDQRPQENQSYGERGGKVGKGAATDIPPTPNFVPSQPAGGSPPPDAPQAQQPAPASAPVSSESGDQS